jgi:hypothetical protein
MFDSGPARAIVMAGETLIKRKGMEMKYTVKGLWQNWAERNKVRNYKRMVLLRRCANSPRAKREFIHFS